MSVWNELRDLLVEVLNFVGYNLVWLMQILVKVGKVISEALQLGEGVKKWLDSLIALLESWNLW